MYDINLKLNLPVPWNNEIFEMSQTGYINYLVGPNGTGKSQFSEQLKNFFNSKQLKCRVLSADRLTGLGFSTKQNIGINNGSYVVSQSNFHEGFSKSNFEYYKKGAEFLDTAVDAFILLEEKIKQIIPKLNVHHKQLFFANTPIFVEGIFDAQFIKALQEKRGVSLEGSGSTVIDVGGSEQLSSYYLLSKLLGKKSLFIYDLDSIFFSSQLRINAEGSNEINKFLTKLGIGDNFKNIWGQFSSTLEYLKSDLRTKDSMYKSHIEQLDGDKKPKKESYALLVYLKHFRDEANQIATNLSKIDLLLSQLNNVIKSFEEIDVYILKNGAMENYFPSYDGNKFNIEDSKKRDCLNVEIDWIINKCQSNEELKNRYGELYEIMEKLPSGNTVDYIKVIESNLKDLIHKIQKGLSENKINNESNLPSYLGKEWNSYQRILSVSDINKESQTFKITLKDLWGFGQKDINIEKNKNYSNESFL